MRSLQRIADPSHQARGGDQVERAAHRVQAIAQRAAADQTHGDVDDVALFAEVVNRQQVGVEQA